MCVWVRYEVQLSMQNQNLHQTLQCLLAKSVAKQRLHELGLYNRGCKVCCNTEILGSKQNNPIFNSFEIKSHD